MKRYLVYIDPYCSGIQGVELQADEDPEEKLVNLGLSEDQCGGEIVHYLVVEPDGTVVKGDLDYT